MRSLLLTLTMIPFPLMGAANDAGDRLFALEVKPILVSKCFSCHGEDPDKLKGELNMLSREDLLKGGETSSNVLVPGKPEESPSHHRCKMG